MCSHKICSKPQKNKIYSHSCVNKQQIWILKKSYKSKIYIFYEIKFLKIPRPLKIMKVYFADWT